MALGGGTGGGNSGGVRAGRAFVELGAKDNLSAHLKRIGANFAEFGKQALAMTGVGGLVGGLLGGVSFKSTADDLAKMKTTVEALGASARGGSGLFGLLNQFSDFGENVEGLTQFSNAIQTALADTSKTTQLFEGLSVSAKDLAGVPLDEQFYRIHDAIRQLPQEQQAFKLGLVGGTDSMKKWLPILGMTTQEIRDQAAALSFGSSELDDATRASKAMAQAGGQINRAWQQAVIALAPLVADLGKQAADGLRPLTEWMKGRNLQDLIDEAVARLNQLWVEVKIGAGSAFTDTWDFFKSGWTSAVYVVKNLFAELADFGAKSVRDAMKGPLDALALINPQLAGSIRNAIDAAGVGSSVLRNQAQKEYDLATAGLKQDAANREATKNRLRAEAQAGIDAVNERVQRQKNTNIFADFMADLQEGGGGGGSKLATAGRAMGTFGGSGDFIARSFGGGGIPKQQLAEQKRANQIAGEQLKLIRDLASRPGFVVT